MIPTSANAKLRKFLDQHAKQEEFFGTPVPTHLNGTQPPDSDLAAHSLSEHAKEDITELQQWLDEIDALPGPERDAARVERKLIEALIAERATYVGRRGS